MLRILPFCFLVFAVSFIDRANVSYAALAMGRDLALSGEAFGFAAGVFFLGYLLCEVPSNAALRRFGARVWLARIQLTWGVVACASAFVQSVHQLYLARFLLGVAEAGLIPGLIAYFNYWFPMRQLARTGALLGAAVPVAYMASGPLSAWIMEHVSVLGLAGWRSMLFTEGVPALITGAATYFVLTERPRDATWLSPDERRWLEAATSEASEAPALASPSTLQVLIDPKTLYLGLIYLLFQLGNFGIGFWMPQLLKAGGKGLSLSQVGWLSAIPYAVATVGLYLWSASSDRSGERRLHAAAALAVAGLGLAACAFARGVAPSLVLLSICLTGFYAFKAPFNVLPRLFLSREASVIAFAVINSVGNLGSFAGPYLFGVIRGHTEGPTPGLVVLAVVTLVAAALTFLLGVGGGRCAAPGPTRRPSLNPQASGGLNA
ncbi:MFS transporter [Caulobacter sp. KR2-114]|uniref:MFS transporter n=1 Tax=Caulobacter sp. KR2-114 TaxID=3400912 RepID=UPI003BFC6E6A